MRDSLVRKCIFDLIVVHNMLILTTAKKFKRKFFFSYAFSVQVLKFLKLNKLCTKTGSAIAHGIKNVLKIYSIEKKATQIVILTIT